jgi:two-component system OmpR family sensor kinase
MHGIKIGALAMTRLFLSLYAFIAITLVVLSAVLNHVFFAQNEDPSHHHLPLLNTLSAVQQNTGLQNKFLKQSGLAFRQVLYLDMPWTIQDKEKLMKGEALVLFDEAGVGQAYFKINERSLYEIDLPPIHQEPEKLYWYSALFFVLLALGTAIWAWPLWRDLQALKAAAKQTDFSLKFAPTALPKHSLVHPIGQALDELNKKVRELIKTQMELTGAVAHEFRTPLSRLKFAMAAYTSENNANEAAINQDIIELEKLMQEMLSYTSLENHQPELNISEIPLKSLCEQRINILNEHVVPLIDIQIRGENIMVLADEHYIERVFDNLYQNALRHAKSKIVVDIKSHEHKVVVCIDDDGRGLATEHLEKVFEPFFRPDQSRVRQRGGAGLGLAIVKRIMIWHGGECWAQQSAIGGARFCFAFTQNQSENEIPNNP